MRCVAPTLRRLDRSLTSFRPSTLRTVPTRALPHAQHIRLQGCLLRGSSIRPQPYHHVSTQLQLRSLCGIPSILLPPVVFAGLMVVLWTWKCFMMVLFQNKIIYMPFLPPNARRETITDYASQCSGMKWREERIRSGDRTKISLCIAVVQNIAAQSASEEEVKEKTVLYFQGNASSLPPRLPFLAQVLSLIQSSPSSTPTRYTFIALSYRGYWTSSGRATEHGIHLDCLAAFQYAITSHQAHHPNKPLEIVIWGQSIGSAFAGHLAANIVSAQRSPGVQLKGLILETPFTNAADMLVTLYPQKWLPYRYLSPFLWNRLDTLGSLERLAEARKDKGKQVKVTILEGGKDELVPKEHVNELEKRGKEMGLDVKRVVVEGALHTGVLAKNSGRVGAAKAIR